MLHAHANIKFGNMIRSLFVLLLLVGFTQQHTPQPLPPYATIRMRFVLDETIGEATFPGTDQRLTPVANMLNNVTSQALGIHIQRLPRARIPFQPVREEGFNAYFERLGSKQAVDTARFRQSPAEFVVILTLRGTQLDAELPKYWQHPDRDPCRIGSYVLMSVSRADGVFKSDEELRDGLLKLLLLGQFGIDNRTGSTCHCFPPCSLFLDCAKEVIAGSFPECLYEIRKADTEADNVAICGNGLVEMGESCDCLVSDTDCRKCCDMTACYKLADTCSGVTYEVKPADKLTTTKMSTTVTEQPKGKNTTTGTTSKTQANTVIVISLIVVGLLFLVLVAVSVVMLLRRGTASSTTRTTRPTTLNGESWLSTTSGVGSAILKSEKTRTKPDRKTRSLKPV